MQQGARPVSGRTCSGRCHSQAHLQHMPSLPRRACRPSTVAAVRPPMHNQQRQRQRQRPGLAPLRGDPLHLAQSSAAAGFDSDSQSSGRSGTSAGSNADSGNGKAAPQQRQPSASVTEQLDELESQALPESFCLIESRDSVKNFATMQLSEIDDNIVSRRNRIFLLMEEVRRLRIQRRLKDEGGDKPDWVPEDRFDSAIPWFPPITSESIGDYWRFYVGTVGAIILFGGLLAPVLEVHLGLGGASYRDFIAELRLPGQLAAVDPIVASFCGGAVGVLTTLMIVEANNASQQEKKRCFYCLGSGYLTCGACVGSGAGEEGGGCNLCSGTGKVMCTACLCTGKAMATEHDPRLDPLQ